MKLSFSTRAIKGYTWDDFFALAKHVGYSGIEIYDIKDPNFNVKGSVFDPAMASAVHRSMVENNMCIPCIDTVCNIADSNMKKSSIDQIISAINIASTLRCENVRVRASKGDEETVYEILEAALPYAEAANVVLLVETCGMYCDTSKLATVLNYFACDNIAALWDMHHTYHYAGESAEKTITNLGAFVRHVHFKDSTVGDGKTEYHLAGDGQLPVSEMLLALRSVNFGGFISLEWDPEWISEIPDMEIISLHFINFMEKYNPEKPKKHGLSYNRAKTGKFIWKKEDLIDMTFAQVLDAQAETFPDQLAFKYTTLDYTRTYSQFRDDVDNFARVLISLGVKAGSKVAAWATNIPQWYIAFWAAAKIGAILVTVNTAYKIHEAEYLLRQSDTHTLIMIDSYRDSNYSQIMSELCPELKTSVKGKPLHIKRLPFLRNIITVGFEKEGCLTWEEAWARANMVPLSEVQKMAAAVKPTDVCNMQYTSGTTGFPKGVMLTHYSVVNNGKCIGDRLDLSTADRMMIQVPMFHCFGMVLSMTSSMTHGATILPIPYFSPKSSLACVNRERITCFNGVPTMFIAMMEHEDFPTTDFSYMRTGIMAGANCPPDLMRLAVKKMNMTEILSVYGQTETSPGSTMGEVNESEDLRVETVGSAFPHVECKVVDPETGEEVADGEIGEFVSRGYNQMKGYYKMPKATAETIDSEGWLHSGDLACRTPDGYYKITGRLKDMIIRGGENIYPREIEEFLCTNPKVSDASVIGVPSRQYGEEVMAWIILKEGVECSEKEMRDYLIANIARHKVPKYLYFTDGFPMNAAGKIQKYKMREQAIEILGLQDEISK